MSHSKKDLAKCIEHTLLKPDASEAAILKLCNEARDYGFRAVCVHPCFVGLCAQKLAGSGTDVVAVVGFPLGLNYPEIKAAEAGLAFKAGANEVDMVMNISRLKDRKEEEVLQDILAVVNESKKFPAKAVKVIIETALLTEEEKNLACALVVQSGAQYVKTSTGFNGSGATTEDVMLIAKALNGRAKIKASGGIKTREQAEALLAAGADRLGTSNGVAILENID